MLMSIKSIARTQGHAAISKDDVGEVVSKSHNKGRSVQGRRKIKRAERQKVAREIKQESNI